MEYVIAGVVVVVALALVEVKVHKHGKPMDQNLQTVKSMSANAKPLPRRHA